MPAASISTRIATLVNLSEEDKKALEDLDVKTEDDLSWIDFEDLPITIPIVKRRKLNIIGDFLTVGSNKLNASTTLSGIRKKVSEAKKPLQTVVQNATSSVQNQAKVDRNSPKVTTNPLKEFTGYP